MILNDEAFSLRQGEVIQAFDEFQTGCLCIAVMARSVEMPPGGRQLTRDKDGAPVESAAIIAAQKNFSRNNWQWMQLAPETKEAIGDYLFDSVQVERDRWYYLVVNPPAESEQQEQVTPAAPAAESE